jgi:hypothetical protein
MKNAGPGTGSRPCPSQAEGDLETIEADLNSLILMICDEDVDKSAHAAPYNCAEGRTAYQGDGGVDVQSGIYGQRNRSSERTAS